jgi:fumarate reductase subunit D
MAKSNEAFWWGLFSAGGQLSALLIPVTVLITGIAVPLGWLSAQALHDLIHHPLTRLYLFALISLSLFHGVHRSLTTLVELGMKGIKGLLAFLLYGSAVVGTVLAAVLLIRL